MALILDTGPLFAAIRADDRDHVPCARLLDTDEGLIVPAPALVETEWLVTSRLGPRAFDAVYGDIEDGTISIAETTRADWRRVRELCSQYADLPLGLVDASVVALAERLGEPAVATLDHRHFTVVRPDHVPSLRLLPD